MMRRQVGAALLALVASTGCAARGPASPPVGADYPGVLADPATITPDFEWRQEIASEYRGSRHSGEVVVQKIGQRLRVIGLAPWGSPAFVLEQVGQHVTFQQLIPHDIPFSPRAVLVDINRAFFGVPASPQSDGREVVERDGESIRQTWLGGKLRERAFERRGGPAGVVRVRYEGGMLWPTPPKTVELDNGWYGYALRITTLSVTQP
jgi:hypothetical protein